MFRADVNLRVVLSAVLAVAYCEDVQCQSKNSSSSRVENSYPPVESLKDFCQVLRDMLTLPPSLPPT